MERRKVRILCIDDHAVVAHGLKASLGIEKDMEWAGWHETADDLVGKFDTAQADIVLMDVDLPGADPFKELESLHELRPEARSIILSAFDRVAYVDAAIAAGAWGYITKSEEFERILGGIRRVAAGEFVFPREVMARCRLVNGRLRSRAGASARFDGLTPREVQVLRMIAQGMSTKDIAAEIHRSVKRVESIRTTIMRKVGVDDRLELARYAIREGLVEP